MTFNANSARNLTNKSISDRENALRNRAEAFVENRIVPCIKNAADRGESTCRFHVYLITKFSDGGEEIVPFVLNILKDNGFEVEEYWVENNRNFRLTW